MSMAIMTRFAGSVQRPTLALVGVCINRIGTEYSFMVRVRMPGGRLSAAQYLALDALSDRYSNSTLRITTRQGIQFHGVLKGNVKPTLAAINRTLLTRSEEHTSELQSRQYLVCRLLL